MSKTLHRIWRAWPRARTPLWNATLVLGFAGAWALGVHGSSVANPEEGFPDHAYHALQLFALEHWEVANQPGWSLQLARWLAPLVGTVAILSLIAALMEGFWTRVLSVRIARLADPVLVAGLGRAGTSLALRFHAAGHAVVGIEVDGSEPGVQLLRKQGIPVVIGDARSREVLAAAGWAWARHLVALCGTTATNAEILASCYEGGDREDGLAPLQAWVHVTDTDLHTLLRERTLEVEPTRQVRPEYFNLFDQGARVLIDRFVPSKARALPFDETGLVEGRAPSLLLVGSSPFQASLLHWLARDFALRRSDPGVRLKVTAVCEDPQALEFALHRRLPGWQAVVELGFVPAKAEAGACHHAIAGSYCSPVRQLDAVFVAAATDEESLGLALASASACPHDATPVFVVVRENEGLGRLLQGDLAPRPQFRHVHVFSLREAVCTADLLHSGQRERIARAIHEAYVRHRHQSEPNLDPRDKALLPWDELSESLRESNRHQADHIPSKLREVNCELVAAGPISSGFAFTEAELEKLSQLEHDRFVDERLHAGWQPGPTKDVERKISPDLIYWDDLTDLSKDKDRNAVRVLPAILERAGYSIRRR